MSLVSSLPAWFARSCAALIGLLSALELGHARAQGLDLLLALLDPGLSRIELPGALRELLPVAGRLAAQLGESLLRVDELAVGALELREPLLEALDLRRGEGGRALGLGALLGQLGLSLQELDGDRLQLGDALTQHAQFAVALSELHPQGLELADLPLEGPDAGLRVLLECVVLGGRRLELGLDAGQPRHERFELDEPRLGGRELLGRRLQLDRVGSSPRAAPPAHPHGRRTRCGRRLIPRGASRAAARDPPGVAPAARGRPGVRAARRSSRPSRGRGGRAPREARRAHRRCARGFPERGSGRPRGRGGSRSPARSYARALPSPRGPSTARRGSDPAAPGPARARRRGSGARRSRRWRMRAARPARS